jgi:hypothetical protein
MLVSCLVSLSISTYMYIYSEYKTIIVRLFNTPAHLSLQPYTCKKVEILPWLLLGCICLYDICMTIPFNGCDASSSASITMNCGDYKPYKHGIQIQ